MMRSRQIEKRSGNLNTRRRRSSTLSAAFGATLSAVLGGEGLGVRWGEVVFLLVPISSSWRGIEGEGWDDSIARRQTRRHRNRNHPMNPEDFEQQLSRRPPRPLPPEWRAEILDAARAAAAPASRSRTGILTSLRLQLAPLVRLHPRALAGMTAVWVVIFALRLATHDESHVAGERADVSGDAIAELREQKQFFAELAGLHEPQNNRASKSLPPGPRSDRRHKATTA